MLGSEAAGKTLSELRKKMEVYQDHWLGSFLLNVAVYSVLVVPGFLFIRYYKKSVRLQTSKCKDNVNVASACTLIRSCLNKKNTVMCHKAQQKLY